MPEYGNGWMYGEAMEKKGEQCVKITHQGVWVCRGTRAVAIYTDTLMAVVGLYDQATMKENGFQFAISINNEGVVNTQHQSGGSVVIHPFSM